MRSYSTARLCYHYRYYWRPRDYYHIITMAKPFPYTFISCPCSHDSIQHPSSDEHLSQSIADLSLSSSRRRRKSKLEDEDDEDGTFDPRAPRSNYSLYPPEHLLYCEDCHQIKCPRCVTEEIVCWYCPSCLFETPSSMVRSEGNRYCHLTIMDIPNIVDEH